MRCRSWLGGAALAAVALPGAAVAQSIEFSDELVDVAISATATAEEPASPKLGGRASVTARLPGLETRLQLGADAGATLTEERALWSSWAPAARSAWWRAGEAGLGVGWTPIEGAKLELQADGDVRDELVLGDSVWTGSSDRRLRTGRNRARAAASFAPLAIAEIALGAEASKQVRETSSGAAGAASEGILDTRSHQLFTSVSWRLLPLLKLDGGASAETIDVVWSGMGERGGSYAFLNPRVGGAFTPLAGTTLKLGVERAVAPMKAEQFIRFAQAAAAAPSPPLFQPDQEWRYKASVQQRLGAAELSATYAFTQLRSVTDLGPVGDAEAPMDLGAGQRRQLEAALAAPIDMFGLPPLTLKVRSAVRDSTVVDPFTGAVRPISGESQYDAELTIASGAAGGPMGWGVTARASGPTALYQMSRITTRGATAGVGGYVAYTPGDLSLRLQLDNILGGARTDRDYLFEGARNLTPLDRVDERRTSDRALRVVLSRAL